MAYFVRSFTLYCGQPAFRKARIKNKLPHAKGQLISKCPFGVKYPFDQNSNEIIVRISALLDKAIINCM